MARNGRLECVLSVAMIAFVTSTLGQEAVVASPATDAGQVQQGLTAPVETIREIESADATDEVVKPDIVQTIDQTIPVGPEIVPPVLETTSPAVQPGEVGSPEARGLSLKAQAIAIHVVGPTGKTIRNLTSTAKGRPDGLPLPVGLGGGKLSGEINESECVVDLIIEFSDASVFERPNVDLCHVDEIVFE